MRKLAAILVMAATSMLLAPGSCRRAAIPSRGVATLGAASAPLVLLYLTDYRCPECRDFATQAFPEIRRRWIDPGVLRVVVHDFATSDSAVEVANAARCAGEFGKFWPFHDALTSTADVASVSALARIAATVGVPPSPFAQCMSGRRYASQIRAEARALRELGITGPPAYAVARAMRELERSRVRMGALSANELDSLVRWELAR